MVHLQRWADASKYGKPELLDAENRWVLLPIDSEHHGKVTFLRVIESKDGELLTVFLKDTTYEERKFEPRQVARW